MTRSHSGLVGKLVSALGAAGYFIEVEALALEGARSYGGHEAVQTFTKQADGQKFLGLWSWAGKGGEWCGKIRRVDLFSCAHDQHPCKRPRKSRPPPPLSLWSLQEPILFCISLMELGVCNEFEFSGSFSGGADVHWLGHHQPLNAELGVQSLRVRAVGEGAGASPAQAALSCGLGRPRGEVGRHKDMGRRAAALGPGDD